MNKDTKLINGAIPITKEQYNKFNEEEFDFNTPNEVIWKFLLEELYTPYIELLGYIPEVWFSILDSDCVRASVVGGLELRSRLSGRDDLDIDCGRLVGLASEMLELK